MTKPARLLLSVCTLFVCASAQAGRDFCGTVTEPGIEQNGGLTFDTLTWDFGTIHEADGAVSHTFSFTNTGDIPAVVEHVWTSCGCTTAQYTRKPLRPGEGGTLTITFDPERRPGDFFKEIHVLSGGRKDRTVLTITGNVVPVPLPPEEQFPFMAGAGIRFDRLHLELGNVQQGATVSASAGIINLADSAIRVAFDIYPADGLLSVVHPQVYLPGERHDMTVTLRIPRGSLYGRFNYRITPVINDIRYPMAVNVSGIAVDDFSASERHPEAFLSQTYFHLGEVTMSSGGRTTEFTIENRGEAPLFIRNIKVGEGVSSSLKTGFAIEPAQAATAQIGLRTDNAQPGLLTGTLVFIVNDPRQPVREVRIAATVIP